jgi:hypothetical protein
LGISLLKKNKSKKRLTPLKIFERILGVMKIKFQIKVKTPKTRGFAIPPNRVIKDKTQYTRKQKHKGGGYEL